MIKRASQLAPGDRLVGMGEVSSTTLLDNYMLVKFAGTSLETSFRQSALVFTESSSQLRDSSHG